jgi:MraZ protein
MFLGQYQHSIDNKGRLTIPARFRELLAAEGAYITRGFDHNLMVLTLPTFNQISRRVSRISMTDSEARLLKRLIFSNAELVEVDRAGRILIPQFLRETVGLDGEAVIVGVGDYFEIWSPELWAGQTAQLQDAEADAQRFMDVDLSPDPE